MKFSKYDICNLSKIVDLKEIISIISKVLCKKYTDVFFAGEVDMSESEYAAIIGMIYKRYKGSSLAKIINSKEFYGIEYATNEYTLDPRPETELMVDLFMKYFTSKENAYEILDLGCGTGCISLSILKHYPYAIATLIDVSSMALGTAKLNATSIGVCDRCDFVISDWFAGVPQGRQFKAILCNPPYIAGIDDPHLEKSALCDPQLALFAGRDGLDAYRTIMRNSEKFLPEHGLLFIEIGINQKNDVAELATGLDMIEVANDFSAIERILVFKRNCVCSKR
jgi:release factor glutamine methyltransferase